MNNYKNLKYIPTWKIKEILNDPYCRGIDGKDYYPVKNELEDILFIREEKKLQHKFDQLEAEAKERNDR